MWEIFWQFCASGAKTALDFVVDRVRTDRRFSVVLGNDPAAFWPSLPKKAPRRIGNSPLASAPAARRSTARDTTAPHRTTEPRSAPHAEPPGRDPTAPVPSRRSSGKKDVCVEATNGPPRGRLRDGPARVHRGSRAIYRAPTRPRLRRGHRADWKGAFHPVTSTHRAPRPASSSEPIHEVNLVHSASFRKPSLTPDIPTCPVP